MQLYVLDRAKNTLATTAEFYNDVHKKSLSTGSSTFEFTIDKSEDAAQYLTSGNYVVFQDDHGRAWSFTVLDYEEHQTSKTVYLEDVGIELINKNMDVWNTTEAHSFAYYFDQITKDTPWQLGINQVADLSRKLVYTGRDTGLGRLLSILKGFDNAECQFNVVIKGNQPVKFIVDVYKTLGTVQDDIQITYAEELDDITKKESRAAFVTALQGVGGVIQPPEGTTVDTTVPEKHVDFADLEYKNDNFVTTKGDKFLRAVKANAYFNPGNNGYIESYYDYDTQSASELLNRTLSQLKIYSEPQYTYEASVKVIDPRLEIGDTVTIIDHKYNPALYLRARVSTLEKSYTDPSKGAVTFINYELIDGSLAGKLQELQTIVNSLPGNATIQVINNNINLLNQTQQKLLVRLDSADGKNSLYYGYKPKTAKNGDVAFVKNADGVTEIWAFVEGVWTLDTGIATFEDVKKAASAAADAGSQATIAGQQASAAGADAKSAGDFAASAASQSTIETAAARSTANSAADAASDAVTAAFGAGTTADQAKSAAAAAKADAASAQSDAADALAEATKSFNDAQNAISNATKAMDAAEQNRTTVTGLTTKVDDITGTIQTLATTQSVDKLAGTVTTVENLAQFASDGLKLKADTSTVDTLKGTVNGIKGELDVQADKIAATVTASDVTGMLGNYATQSWSQGQISAAKNEISASVETVNQRVNNLSVGGVNLLLDTDFNNLPQYWTSHAGTVTGTFNGHNVIYYDATKLTDGFTDVLQQPIYDPALTTNRVLPSHWYTLSFYVKGSGQMYTYVYGSFVDTSACSYIDGVKYNYTGSDGYHIWDLTDDWIRHTYTFKSKSSFLATEVQNVLWRLFKGNEAYITMPQLEAGTLATDYSPAPEDMASQSWTKSLLDVSEGKVSAQVQSVKTDLTNATNTLNNNIANATADMATETWVNNKVSLTEDGLTADIQKLRTDTTNNIASATAGMATQTWTQGKLDLTADGFKTQISSMQNGLDTKYTSLEQTLKGVQATANNAVTQSQYTQLANQFTTTIANVGAPNLVSMTGWTDVVTTTHAYYTGTQPLYRIDNASISVQQVMARSSRFAIKANTTYTLSFFGFGTSNAKPINVYVLGRKNGETADFTTISLPIVMLQLPSGGDNFTFSGTFTTGAIDNAYVRVDNNGTTDSTGGSIYFTEVQLEEGSVATPYRVSDNQISSQFTQLQNDINLRVKTGDLVSQIDVNAKRILLDGASTYITNTTHIDTGVIKTAMIADAAITNAKIANASIDNAKIADASINSAKIADLAVGSAQIADGAISSAKIGNATITSAKIADASILNAKIVSLDGSKIVANSITADKLDVNAIAVGLNKFGTGWQITPASIAFLPPGTTKASLSLTGDLGIMFGDIGNGESLAVMQGTPYDTTKDTWYNGLQVTMLNNGDFFGLSADTGTTTEAKMIWSRSVENNFNIKKGFSFYDDAFFAKNVTTMEDLFINRIGVKDANNNGHALKYNWVDGVGIAQLAGNGKAGVLIEEVGGDVKFLIDGSQYSLRDIIIHAMHWA